MNYREMLTDDIVNHLKWHNYGKNPYGGEPPIPPLDYSIQGLQYVRIPQFPESILFSEDVCRDYFNSFWKGKSAFESIELMYPSDILQHRIIFLD